MTLHILTVTRPIRSCWLVDEALTDFIGLHTFQCLFIPYFSLRVHLGCFLKLVCFEYFHKLLRVQPWNAPTCTFIKWFIDLELCIKDLSYFHFIPTEQTPHVEMRQVHRGRLWLKCYQSNQLLQTTILRSTVVENNYDWKGDFFLNYWRYLIESALHQ